MVQLADIAGQVNHNKELSSTRGLQSHTEQA